MHRERLQPSSGLCGGSGLQRLNGEASYGGWLVKETCARPLPWPETEVAVRAGERTLPLWADA